MSTFRNINENRWTTIENTLENLSIRVSKLRQQLGLNTDNALAVGATGKDKAMLDLVVHANPDFPPYSLQFFSSVFSQNSSVFTSVHVHSSLTKSIPYHLLDLLEDDQKENKNSNTNRTNFEMGITVIWTSSIGKDPILVVNPTHRVQGEVNIARYLTRLLEKTSACALNKKNPSLQYDELSVCGMAQMDEELDLAHQFIHTGCVQRRQNLMERLLSCAKKKSGSVAQNNFSISDIVLLSISKQEHERNPKFFSSSQKQVIQDIKRKCIDNYCFMQISLFNL